MGGLTSAVHWWEEWQLRVLVLTSLFIQLFLLTFPVLRRQPVYGWFKFIMWLAYHGGDAVAIYALATLFNRHKDQGGRGGGDGAGGTLLEVVWAPVLLIHLGGVDGVTAYNIEDNELWSRHLLTAVSQITVAVYVFTKSWSSSPGAGDKRLLAAAILLFIVGVAKCFMKAWAFKRASIYSLVNLGSAVKQPADDKLEDYVKAARDIVVAPEERQVTEEDPGRVRTTGFWAQLVEMIKLQANAFISSLRRQLSSSRNNNNQETQSTLFENKIGEASKLFVDLSSPYSRRIAIFKKFWSLKEDTEVYDHVRGRLASAFLLLYTRLKTAALTQSYEQGGVHVFIDQCMVRLRMVLPWASIGLFHSSHREAFNVIDVNVTYAIFCCTAWLDFYSFYTVHFDAVQNYSWLQSKGSPLEVWPETVAQYSLAGYFVRNKKHSITMGIVNSLGCKDFLDQLWCMEPCYSSARITSLVLGYLKDGWKYEIRDAASYRTFNNHSSQIIKEEWNLNRPFDECVLVWHLATDFCFFSSSSFHHICTIAEPQRRLTLRGILNGIGRKCGEESVKCKAVQCRQMSNYMVYLLFVNPEMLLPGTRQKIFKTAYGEFKNILRGWNWNPVCWSRCTPCGVKLIEEERMVMEKLIEVMENPHTVIPVTEQNSQRNESFIDQAWAIKKRLSRINPETERWKEIQNVWVQMLCFSASRCRGYLHAKALGKGGEFLSYVWLLLFHMGMETFSERLQRELLPSCQGNNDNGSPPTSTVHSRAGASTTASTS